MGKSKGAYREFGVYQAALGPLAPGISGQTTFQIRQDADFELQKLSFVGVNAGGQAVLALQVTVQVEDPASGRKFFDGPVPLSGVFGSGQFPFILPVTMMLEAGTMYLVTLSNVHAATTYNTLLLDFIGVNVYRFG